MKNKQIRRKILSNQLDVISLIGKKTAYGAECKFFKMSNNSRFGIKAYFSIEEAESSWRMQKKAAKMGIGPKVGKLLIIKHRDNKNEDSEFIFGYETQVAEAVKGEYKNKIWKDQNKYLEEKLIRINCCDDFFPHNCGIINGKLVLVDFGAYSTFY